MSAEVTIVDAGIGNIRSVLRMFEEAGVEAALAAGPAEAEDSRRLVLPGVGAFDAGMAALEQGGWRPVLDRLALAKGIPVLGICLGMQLFCRESVEGSAKGLGWIAADVERLDTGGDPRLKIPHMGWADVVACRPNPLIETREPPPRFYHVHKYRVVCDDDSDVLATAEYGRPFVSAVQRENIFGVQFHPEKSHRFGMALLARFATLPC